MGDFIDLKLPPLRKLRLLRRNGDTWVFHAVFKRHNVVPVLRVTKRGLPRPLTLAGSLIGVPTPRSRTVSEKACPIIFIGLS